MQKYKYTSFKNYIIDTLGIVVLGILTYVYQYSISIIKMFILIILSILFIILMARILRRIFINNFNIYGSILNFCMISIGFFLLISGFFYAFNYSKTMFTVIITLGSSVIGWGINNIIRERENIRLSGEWRKKLYELEQKEIYTLYDLYKINSYINPYSTQNDISILINDVISTIFNQHTNGDNKINNSEYIELKSKLISYLSHGNKKVTAFDYGIKQNNNNIEIYNIDSYPNKYTKTSDEILNPFESNLIRLSCHVLLKAEWNEWIN